MASATMRSPFLTKNLYYIISSPLTERFRQSLIQKKCQAKESEAFSFATTRTERDKNEEQNQSKISTGQHMEKKSKTMIYQCPKCSTKTGCCSTLLLYLALYHFRKTLKQYFTKKVGECCKCTRLLSSQNSLLYHLAVNHNALAKLIPEKKLMLISENSHQPEHKISTGKTKSTEADLSAETVEKSNVLPSVIKKNRQEPHQNQADSSAQPMVASYYQCHLCDERNTDYLLLLKHMAKDHFREEMREYYGEENGECHLCKKIMLNEDCLLIHLPVRHSALDRLIPGKEFLLVTYEEECDNAELASMTEHQVSKSVNDFKMPKPKKANETPNKRPQKSSQPPSKKASEENETPSKN